MTNLAKNLPEMTADSVHFFRRVFPPFGCDPLLGLWAKRMCRVASFIRRIAASGLDTITSSALFVVAGLMMPPVGGVKNILKCVDNGWAL